MLVKILKKYASDMRSGTGKDVKTDGKIFRRKSKQEHFEKAAKERKELTR